MTDGILWLRALRSRNDGVARLPSVLVVEDGSDRLVGDWQVALRGVSRRRALRGVPSALYQGRAGHGNNSSTISRGAAPTGTVGTPRSSLSVILLSIVTLGIYGLYWQYKTFEEMRDHTGEGIGGVVGLILAIFLGFVNPFIMSAEVGNMYEAAGDEKPVSGITGLWILLPLIGAIVWLVKTQSALNQYWEARGAV